MAFYGFKVILTVLDEEKRGTRRKEGRGGRNDEEEGTTRRKERRGGRSDEEREKNEKVVKNEKVAWGRIIDLWVLFLLTGVFFYLTSEIWLNKDIQPVFQPGESDSGVRISKKWGLVGPQGPWMSIFEGFWWISTFLAIQGPEMPYFYNQEEVDTVSEPVWCAENNGDSLEVQFWAHRVQPGPWMSILGIFWQFSWFFPNFLL